MLDGLRPAQKQWILGIVLVLWTCLVYLPILQGGFVWDDSYMVTDNKALRGLEGLKTIWFTNKLADPYRVTMSAFWLQWNLWPGNPLPFHIVNVLTHALGAVLLWRVLLRLRVPGGWLAALVFAIHPVGAASAAWISEQKNTWSIIFYLLTLLCYLRFEEKPTKGRYLVALFMYVCALMSKGSVVMLPVVLLLVAWWQRNRITKQDLIRIAPYFVLSFFEGLMTIWFQNHFAIGGSMVQELNRAGQVAAAGYAVWFYLWKDWVPWNICVIYPQWHIDPHSPLVYVPGLLLIGLLVVAWRFRSSWGRHVLFALGVFTVTLFPVMGFFNMYFLVFSRVADHWQYLAMLASVPLAVCGLVYLIKRAKVPRAVTISLVVALLGSLSISTWIRAGVYRNEETLWTDTVNKNPNAWMAYNNLGNALGNRKDSLGSIAAYRRAIAIKPDFSDAQSNLGNALVAQYEELKHKNKAEAGVKLDEAVDHLAKAVTLEPRMANFHFNYGIGLVDEGKLDEGIKEYQKAIELRGGFADCRNNLANALLKVNRPKEALEQALIAVQINNSAEAHYNAGSAYHALNDVERAKKEFETALSMKSNLTSAHYECGMMLAMSGQFEQALPHFQAYVQDHPDDETGHGSLGNVYASLHRLNEALTEYQTALKIQPNDGQVENNIANVYLESGKIPEALQHYQRAVTLHTDDSGSHANYAAALVRAGNKQQALAEYREALRLEPGNAQLQARLNALMQQK